MARPACRRTESGMSWRSRRNDRRRLSLSGEGSLKAMSKEVSPAGACNHRCTFCALDYVGYRNRFLEADLLGARLDEDGVVQVD